MIYLARIGRRFSGTLLPELILLAESEEILIATLSCTELEDINYVVKEISEISEDMKVKEIFRGCHGNEQSGIEKDN